jgi:thiosulfate dehydrogenase [quinone] large subunit
VNNKVVKTESGTVITNPPIARFLFDDTRFSAVWLVIRVLVGWQWVAAGWHKVGDPGWMQTGEALKGFWARIVTVPAAPAQPLIYYDWYRAFIQGLLDSGAYVWFAKLVAIGEVAVGVALIIGAFVGIAAFFGALMNWNYLMAGALSSNPLLMIGALALILAWKTAGWYGLDRILLPRLGTPWTRKVPQEQTVQERTTSPTTV